MNNVETNFVEKARTELGEDENIKNQSLKQFREWIEKQAFIKSCRTDDNFLLRFLRVKKYSFLGATKRLENFLITVKAHPRYFKNADINIELVEKLVDSGYFLLFPGRDQDGCRSVMLRPKVFDMNVFNVTQSIGLNILLFEAILNEPETQISGIRYILDFSDLPLNFLGSFTISEYKHFIDIFQNAMPFRVKGIYFMNLPSFANSALQLAIRLMSEKMKKRIHFLNSIDELKTKIDPSLIPQEYGGEIPIKEMIIQQKQLFKTNRSSILETFACEIDEKLIPSYQSSSCNEIDAGVAGSFRKLEID